MIKFFRLYKSSLLYLLKKDEYMKITKNFSRINDTKSIRVISLVHLGEPQYYRIPVCYSSYAGVLLLFFQTGASKKLKKEK
jgi:hypothetical protein